MKAYKARYGAVEQLSREQLSSFTTPKLSNKFGFVPRSIAMFITSSLLGLNVAVAQQVNADSEEETETNQRVLEEIVITARFREESINDVGASISALSAQTLERAGIVDLSLIHI